MAAVSLEDRLREQRRVWVPLADGRRRIRFSRPLVTQLRTLAAGVTLDVVCQYVDGWDGFTEADILGAAVGGDAPAEFTPGLFKAWAADDFDVLRTVAEAIADAVRRLIEERGLVEKN